MTARYVLLESVRRRTLLVMGLITLVLVALFAWAVAELDAALADVPAGAIALQVDPREFAAVQLAGIAVFAIFFIGAVLGVLLNQSAVRGDAEQGLLQQLVARPIGRMVLLTMRFGVVAGLCAAYVAVVYGAVAGSLLAFGTWDPGSIVLPGAYLAAAVACVCALTVAVSVVLPTTSTGIATFLLVGVGLGAGFMLELARTVGSESLDVPATLLTWLLPYERLYQAAIHELAPTGSAGFTAVGPLTAGRDAGPGLLPWAGAWLVLVVGGAAVAFRRRDL